MKKTLSLALLSSLALADITNSINTIDNLIQKVDNIDMAIQRQEDATILEEFLQKIAGYEIRLNQFVNRINFDNVDAQKLDEFLTKSEELAFKTQMLTEKITSLVNSSDKIAPNYIHTLDALLATTLRLSDDIGVMADRIGEMADRIVYTEELIGQMADRIVHTEHLITETATKMANMISTAQEHLTNVSANSYANSAVNSVDGIDNMPQVADGMPPAGIDNMPMDMPQMPEMPAEMPNMMDSMTPQQQEMMQNMMNQMINR
jgi:methyl-accepting chemotaxis protein